MNNPELHTIFGIVDKTIFRDPAKDFAILAISVCSSHVYDETNRPKPTRKHFKHATDNLVVSGNLPVYEKFDKVVILGSYVDHPRYGRQLKVAYAEAFKPMEQEEFITYLGSGIIEDIGSEIASKIVEHLGKDAWEILNTTPEAVKDIKGIGKKRLQNIVDFFSKTDSNRDTIQFLISHGIGMGFTNAILQQYATDTIAKITENPYILAYDIEGIGFKKADEIAQTYFDITPLASVRVTAGLWYTLDQVTTIQGHCFLTYSEIKRELYNLIPEVYEYEELVIEALSDLSARDKIVITKDKKIYPKRLFDAELNIIEFCKSHSSYSSQFYITDRDISDCEELYNIQYTEDQLRAIKTSSSNHLSIITGGPGTGKTTIIRTLIKTAHLYGQKVVLCAPTGKAAKRMMDVTNHPASTIHRLFGSIEEGNCHLTGDLLIVDESSMIDVQLFSALINIVPKHMRIVIVGDKDQLPSIGPGKILADMIASGFIPSTTLSMIHRRYDGSLINQISHDVNHGIMPEFSTFGKDLEGEAYFIDLFDPADIVKKIEYLATEYIPKTYGYSPADIMVLSPMNKNELGIWNLNTILQATINPPANNKIEFSPFANTIYREGDLVIQRVNNYKIDPKGVFNGETGQILEIDPKKRIILVELLDRRIIKYDFIDVVTNLSLNYAITIHRSQGSESKCVIMVMHDQHHIMLGRQLIYTGITRAKDKLFLLGTRTALAYACGNATAQNRNSAICTSLKLEK